MPFTTYPVFLAILPARPSINFNSFMNLYYKIPPNFLFHLFPQHLLTVLLWKFILKLSSPTGFSMAGTWGSLWHMSLNTRSLNVSAVRMINKLANLVFFYCCSITIVPLFSLLLSPAYVLCTSSQCRVKYRLPTEVYKVYCC